MTENPNSSQPAEGPSPLPRRFLLGASVAAVATGTAQLVQSPAEAASATTTWKLGGNSSVTDTNYLGVTNVADLIFKTTATAGGTPTERMRIASTGMVGIGKTPTVRLDVSTSAVVATRSTSTSASATAIGVSGISKAGSGVKGTSTDGAGVSGTSTNGFALQGDSGYVGAYAVGGTYGGYFTGTGSGSVDSARAATRRA